MHETLANMEYLILLNRKIFLYMVDQVLEVIEVTFVGPDIFSRVDGIGMGKALKRTSKRSGEIFSVSV